MTTSAELDGLLDQAKERVRQRDYAQAIELYRQAIEADDCQVAAHEGLARAAFLSREYDLAISHFQRIFQLDPRR